YPQEHRFSFGL
nr:allatostatin VI [Diploptera punctata]